MRIFLTGIAALALAIPAALQSISPAGGGVIAHAEANIVAPGIGEQLRYVGRDVATGMAKTVNDRFIAEVERSYQLYGIEEAKAIPPPPAAGTDIAGLRIPALGVDAPVARYGVDRFGRLDVPQDTRTVGWNPGYTALPGTASTTFLAAHFEYGGRPGVFNRINQLVAGDEVVVRLSDGADHRYRVTSTISYVLETIDMGAILQGREGRESITLMTCSGRPNARGYSERTVVLADAID